MFHCLSDQLNSTQAGSSVCKHVLRAFCFPYEQPNISQVVFSISLQFRPKAQYSGAHTHIMLSVPDGQVLQDIFLNTNLAGKTSHDISDNAAFTVDTKDTKCCGCRTCQHPC